MCNAPLVSICCLTYNHESFLRQCLDGFVMQKTSFEFEIVVHDDASTDGTREILAEYSLKYPTVFRLILQEENQYSKGVDVLTHLFSHAKGKYIAFCEGDDYWTDPLKLQKQVDWLDQHSEYSICLSRCHFYDEESQKCLEVYPLYEDGDNVISLSKYVKGCNMPQTLTAVFRAHLLKASSYMHCQATCDMVIYYFLLKFGLGYCLPESTGVYRIHSKGIWSGMEFSKRRIWEINNVLSICKVDNAIEAKQFLLYQFLRPFSRKFILLNFGLFAKVYSVLSSSFGTISVLHIFIAKLLFNKNLHIDKICL